MTQAMLAHAVPIFRRQLMAMLSWLDKADAHAKARDFSPDSFLAQRLAPDMLPFVEQIHRAADVARTSSARLCDRPVVMSSDRSTTLAECGQYVRKTLDSIEVLPADRLVADDPSTVALTDTGGGEHVMPADEYWRHLVLPNFFFHVTMAYALLRQAGLDIGKGDYLGH
jgi:uncharacterized protein